MIDWKRILETSYKPSAIAQPKTNHAELSRDLALAIGYYPESARTRKANPYASNPMMWAPHCEVYGDWWTKHKERPEWRVFDYRDPTVWGPVLEWLMCREVRPEFYTTAPHFGMLRAGEFGRYPPIDIEADTLPEAVARAAIAIKEQP